MKCVIANIDYIFEIKKHVCNVIIKRALETFFL